MCKKIVYCFVLIMSFALISCGKRDTNVTVNPDGSYTVVATDGSNLVSYINPELAKENVYAGQILDVTSDTYNNIFVYDLNIINSDIFVSALLYNYSDNQSPYIGLISMNKDGGNQKIIECEKMVPTDYVNADNINVEYGSLYVSYDKHLVGLCTVYYNFQNQNSEQIVTNYICYWSNNGELLWTKKVDINGISAGAKISYFCSLGDALYFYINDVNCAICRINLRDQELIFKVLNSSDSIYTCRGLIDYNNDVIVAYTNANNEYCMSVLDEALNIKEDLTLPGYVSYNGCYDVCRGKSNDIVYSNRSGVFAFDFGSSEYTKVMDYVNSDFDGYYISNVNMLSKDSFIATYYSITEKKTVIASFSYVDPKNIGDKSVVSLGVYGIDDNILKKVVDFNMSNPNYRVVVNDYSEYSNTENYYYGYDVLYDEIDNGTGPDVLMVDPQYFDYRKLAELDKFAAFESFKLQDADLSLNNYLANVFDSYAVNDKHYIMPYCFYYDTFIGNAQVLDNRSYWTIDEFTSFVKKNSDVDFSYGIDREQFLDYVIEYAAIEFIDYDSKSCDFNSNDFIALMEYAKGINEKAIFDYHSMNEFKPQYRDGDILLIPEKATYIDSFWRDAFEYFDGNACMIGFPGRNEESAVICLAECPIMITSGGNTQGAWEYARQYFTYEYQYAIEDAIPVLDSAFYAWGENITDFSNESYYYDGASYPMNVMSTGSAEAFVAKVLACTKHSLDNYDVEIIIREEAGKYFDGTVSSKEMAENIQERVATIL